MDNLTKSQIEHQIYMESNLIGMMLLNNDLIEECVIDPKELISNSYNAKLLELLKYIRIDEGIQDIDVVTLTKYVLEKGNRPEEFGGPSYIAKIMSESTHKDNFDTHQKFVRESYVERETKSRLDLISSMIGNGGNVKKHLATLQSEIEELEFMLLNSEDDSFQSLEQRLEGFHDTLEERGESDGIQGANTISKSIDEITNGHLPGKVKVVGARPSMGKTAYAMSDAEKVTDNPKNAAIFYSKEMPGDGITERSVSALGQIDSYKLKSGNLDDVDWVKYANVVRKARGRHLYIDDYPSMTFEYIKRTTKRMVKKLREQGVNRVVIYVDYLQLLSSERNFGNDTRRELGYMCKGFKMLARELGITVVLLSQLNRSVEQRENKRPMMSDLKDASDIEQVGDVIEFLYRDDYYDKESDKKGIIEIIIGKNRDGETCTVEMIYLRQFNKFVDIERG